MRGALWLLSAALMVPGPGLSRGGQPWVGANFSGPVPRRLQAGTAASDKTALLAFRASGSTWPAISGWDAASAMCGWAGITCDGSGRAVSLNLYTGLSSAARSQVRGDIAQLAACTALTYVRLYNTGVTGSFAALAAGLPSLTYLNLGNLAVTGSVGTLGACTSLTYRLRVIIIMLRSLY
jgi:hypothetical protein